MKELKNEKINSGWFKTGNIFIDKYARHIGPLSAIIYICLKRHANSKNRIAFPSHKLISEELNMSTRTVIRHISTLEKYGFITTTKRKSRGLWQKNEYYLTYSRDWLIKPRDLKSPMPYD